MKTRMPSKFGRMVGAVLASALIIGGMLFLDYLGPGQLVGPGYLLTKEFLVFSVTLVVILAGFLYFLFVGTRNHQRIWLTITLGSLVVFFLATVISVLLGKEFWGVSEFFSFNPAGEALVLCALAASTLYLIWTK